MIELDNIREYIKKKMQEDGSRRSITIKAPSIEQALAEASVELNSPVDKVDYEVLDQGSPGFFGVGKRDWTILAYVSGIDSQLKMSARQILRESGIVSENAVNIDGEILVHTEKIGMMLCVTPPKQGGAPASFEEAMSIVKERLHGETVDEKLVRKIVDSASGEFIKILSIKHNPSEDALVSFTVSEDNMEAYVTISPPGKGGADTSGQYIKNFLKRNGIVHGYDEKKLKVIEDNPEYNTPILVAKGLKPKNGENARIEYKFDTENKIKIKATNQGKVNFKELNKINNVIEGSTVAEIIKKTDGQEGYTVRGDYLEAKNGEDIDVQSMLGSNIELSQDGLFIIAKINGQVNVINGKINVDEVFVVDGNVDLKTGNITFLGNIIVRGSVEDGFSIKSSGSIEIFGHVGKCSIDSRADLIVHQGISGREDVVIKSGGTVYSKFIENATIDSEGDVLVTDGIINSRITCGKKVICKGKKATVVGGEITAYQEIIAKNIGSSVGTETIVKAGTDPKAKLRIEELRNTALELHNEQIDINHNYMYLLNQLKEDKEKISAEKISQMKELKKRKKDIERNLADIDKEIATLVQKVKDAATLGKISASNVIFPGVFVTIKDVDFPVKNEFTATSFYLKDSYIETKPFSEKDYEDADFAKQYEKKKD